jgi:flagellar protein FlgJ
MGTPFSISPNIPEQMLNSTQSLALASAKQQARACEAATGCPALLTIAQWALESGWGKYAPGNNCFGIKVYSGAYGLQHLATHEYVAGKSEEANLSFATFPTLEACFEKHAQLITGGNPYRVAWAHYTLGKNVEQLVRDIAPHYAPGNPKYIDSVLAVMRMPQVSAP